MKALVITTRGNADEVLQIRDVPVPALGPDELRVQVRAAGLNRADLLQCLGRYPAPPGSPQDIPGLEFAGDVLETGSRATRFHAGDRVMGIVGGGAMAEQVIIHDREALRVPAALRAEDAAGIPEAFLTAFDALVLQGGLTRGENVLVHAVTSGVGTAAVQLAQLWDARTLGTGRNKTKLDRCVQELGLEHAFLVEPGSPRFAPAVKLATQGRGATIALDLAGGPYLPETLECMSNQGRVLCVGIMAGAKTELNLGLLLERRLRIHGTVLRSRPLEEKIALAQRWEQYLLPAFDAGRLRPVIDAVLPFHEFASAYQRLAQNIHFGKIVLRW